MSCCEMVDAPSLKDLAFKEGKLFYKSVEMPVKIQFITWENYLLAVCSNTELENLTPISL